MAGTRGKSARGEVVDFDNLAIKQKLADAPKTSDVEKREEMIIAKSKRNKVVKKTEEKPKDEK